MSRWKAKMTVAFPFEIEASSVEEARTAIAQEIGNRGGPKVLIVWPNLSAIHGFVEMQFQKVENGEE